MNTRMRNPEFWLAKGPDFISRLRWHINITSLDRPTSPRKDDRCIYRVRRAIAIYALLKKSDRLLAGKDPLEPSLRKAFLDVSSFRHGMRSIEAILAMCNGVRGEPLRVMHLPPRDHLDMHVDAREFLELASASA
jgi:hypothetical protein